MTMKNVKLGQVFESRKVSGQKGTVTAIGDKVELTLADGETKMVSESTLGRWWKLVAEAEPATPAVQEENNVAEANKEDRNIEVQLHEAQEENPADGKIVETEKQEEAPVDTNNNEKPADDTDKQDETPAPENKPADNKPEHRGRGKQAVDPAVQKMFTDMVAHMVDMGAVKRETGGYVGLYVDKRNIAEVTLQKKGIRINLNSQSLSAENMDLCKIVPDTYGWTLDSVYKVTKTEQYDTAVEMLEQGFAFRKKPAEPAKPEDDKQEQTAEAK